MSRLSTRTKACLCPYCGYLLDGATGLADRAALPKPGDVSLCFACGGLLRFRPDLTLRKLEDAEHLLLALEERALLQNAMRMIARFNRASPRKPEVRH